MGGKNKKRTGVVYSTNKEFNYNESEEEVNSISIEDQLLYISLDRKMRKGKVVTLIEGYVGSEEDMKQLAKEVKQKCGAGGAAKNGLIMVQGDFKDKIYDYLTDLGYACKKKGG